MPKSGPDAHSGPRRVPPAAAAGRIRGPDGDRRRRFRLLPGAYRRATTCVFVVAKHRWHRSGIDESDPAPPSAWPCGVAPTCGPAVSGTFVVSPGTLRVVEPRRVAPSGCPSRLLLRPVAGLRFTAPRSLAPPSIPKPRATQGSHRAPTTGSSVAAPEAGCSAELAQGTRHVASCHSTPLSAAAG